ncbi:MAG: hypothetical protein FJ288_11450 [Planctomycetes bacterium]|nr:hypothetical protein [Planctomycetota bacterium]
MKKDDHNLFVIAIRHFRAWGAALRTAGLDDEAVSGRRTWTGDQVIQAIHRFAREGIALNYASVTRVDQGLVIAAKKLLGSWDNALWAAGYDPLDIRRSRRPWTKSEVVAAIQARAAAGAPMTQKGMNSNSIPPAARRLFGSLKAALRKAGVLHLAGPFPRWSRTAIINAIHARLSAGKPLHCTAVVKDAPRLYDAARRYFQGWSHALRAAGIDPVRTRRKRRPWTPEDVTRELRRRAVAGQPATCISAIRPVSLVRACIVFFGSLENATAAAKVDPAKIGYRRSQGNHRRRKRRQANGRRC